MVWTWTTWKGIDATSCKHETRDPLWWKLFIIRTSTESLRICIRSLTESNHLRVLAEHRSDEAPCCLSISLWNSHWIDPTMFHRVSNCFSTEDHKPFKRKIHQFYTSKSAGRSRGVFRSYVLQCCVLLLRPSWGRDSSSLKLPDVSSTCFPSRIEGGCFWSAGLSAVSIKVRCMKAPVGRREPAHEYDNVCFMWEQ